MPHGIAIAIRGFGLAVLTLMAGCMAPQTIVELAPAPPIINSTTAGSYLMARQAAKVRDAERAAVSFQNVLARDPGNRTVVRQAFFSELQRGNIPAAVGLVRDGEKNGLVTPFMHTVLALDRTANMAWPEAQAYLSQAQKSPWNQALVPLLSGWMSVGQGDGEGAQAAFRKVGSMPGFEYLALKHVGHAARLSGDLASADRAFRKALNSKANPSLRLVVAASLHFAATGRLETAREVVASRPNLNHEFPTLSSQLDRAAAGATVPGLVSSAAGGMSEALFDIANVLKREPGNGQAMILAQLALYMNPACSVARLLAGEILDTRGRHASALDLYRAIPETSIYHSAAQLREAASLHDLGQTDDAIRTLRALAKRQPTVPGPWIQIGDIESQRKRWSEAIAAYDNAFERIGATQQGHWNLYFTRGIAFDRGKQWDRAEADFLAALELFQDQPYVMNYLGYSWTEQGVNLDKAEVMIKKAAQLRPNDGYIIDSLGWILYRTGRFGKAVERLEHAVRLRPNDPTINDHLGDAYWRVGRRVEARFQWRRVLGMKPEVDLVGTIETKLKQGLPPVPTEAEGRRTGDNDQPGA